MTQADQKFVNIVKTFDVSDKKSINGCEACLKNVSDEDNKDPQYTRSCSFSRGDLQRYIYQSSARQELLSY